MVKSRFLARFAATTVFPALLLTLVTACGGGSSGGATGGDSYSGPGSRWDVFLADDGTFNITRSNDVTSPVDLVVDGTWVRLASGFLKLTVSSASGIGAPSPGDVGYALDAPGYALMLKPLDPGSDQLLSMVTGGECPVVDIDANWVIVKHDGLADASAPGRDFFGTFHYDVATGTPSLPNRIDLAGYTDSGLNAMTGGTCSNGIMQVADAVMYLTANGGAIVRVNTADADPDNDEFIFGLGQKAIGTLANTDGDYAGWLFDENQVSGAKISPVSLSCGGGTCSGALVTDIDTNTTDPASTVMVTLGVPDALADGLVTGSITSSEPGSFVGNIACMADVDALGTGKKIISCVGQSPGDVSKMFNVLFVSKDLAL